MVPANHRGDNQPLCSSLVARFCEIFHWFGLQTLRYCLSYHVRLLPISAVCNADVSSSLGAGLDKITSGFQTIVGNTGLGRNGIPLFISAALIFIGFFSLYFGTPGSTRELGHGRALAWFFSQFFFLASLIVALQGFCSLVLLVGDTVLTQLWICLFSGIATALSFTVRSQPCLLKLQSPYLHDSIESQFSITEGWQRNTSGIWVDGRQSEYQSERVQFQLRRIPFQQSGFTDQRFCGWFEQVYCLRRERHRSPRCWPITRRDVCFLQYLKCEHDLSIGFLTSLNILGVDELIDIWCKTRPELFTVCQTAIIRELQHRQHNRTRYGQLPRHI